MKRSADSFSRALWIAASTLGGTAFRWEVADLGVPAMILPRIACGVLPMKGGSPVSISKRTQPSA